MPKSNKEKKQENQKLSKEEFEAKVVELAKSGLTSEKIGESLRRQGIHPMEFSKKISLIPKENKLYVNPDLKNVEAKLSGLERHHKVHKKDKRALRERERVFSQARKLKKYFG